MPSTYRIGTEASANPVRGKKLAQVIAKLLPLQLLRGVGLEQRQHVHFLGGNGSIFINNCTQKI